MSGRAVPVIEGRRRSGDPPALIANPQLGQSLLGWKPRKSDLQTIVRTAWDWYEKRQELRDGALGKRELVGTNIARKEGVESSSAQY